MTTSINPELKHENPNVEAHDNHPSKKQKTNKHATITKTKMAFAPALTIPHPLGVRPSGNALLLFTDNKESSPRRTKTDTLGPYLGKLTDELLMTVLQELENPKDLLNVGHVCKSLFAYAWSDDLWKYMVYRYKKSPNKWYGSWRRTYWEFDEPESSEEEQQQENGGEPVKRCKEARVDCKGIVFSDILYRPYQCSQIDYKRILERVLKEDLEEEEQMQSNSKQSKLIPIFKESEMTLERFNKSWSNKPFMLNLAGTETSPAAEKIPLSEESKKKGLIADWTVESLVERFGDVVFRQEYMDWKLKVYYQYMKNNQDESPLYLFDCRSEAMRGKKRSRNEIENNDSKEKSKSNGQLSNEYRLPGEAFTGPENDMFTVFGDHVRPNYRWLILGPERSGSSFHKDPNATSAWNAVLTGHKYWIMFPSSSSHFNHHSGGNLFGISSAAAHGNITDYPPPPGITTDESESEVTAPVSIAEWFQGGYYDMAREQPGFCHGICGPGQMMYVPSGWWHLVVNIDKNTECMALTGNFVPQVNLGKVLDFLHNKHDQISGFKWRVVEKEIKKNYLKTNGYNYDNDDKEKEDEDNANDEEDDDDDSSSKLDISKYIFYFFMSKILQSGNEQFIKSLQSATAMLPVLMMMRERENQKRLEREAQEAAEAEGLSHHKESEKWKSLVNTEDDKPFSFGFDIDEE